MNFWQVFFELKTLTEDTFCDPHLWEDNPPRYLRYRMLDSICKSLEIDLIAVQKNQFSTKLTTSQLSAFLHELSQNLTNKEFAEKLNSIIKNSHQIEYGMYDLMGVYTKLVEIRSNIFSIQTHFSGVYFASGINQLPILLNDKIIQKIEEELNLVDQLLMLFLNPTNTKLDVAALIRDFSFPDVDIDEVDIDFF